MNLTQAKSISSQIKSKEKEIDLLKYSIFHYYYNRTKTNIVMMIDLIRIDIVKVRRLQEDIKNLQQNLKVIL